MSHLRLALSLCLLMFSSVALAKTEVENLRIWLAPDNTRLVFDLSGPVQHSLFTLDNPARVVIDIEAASLKADLTKLEISGSPISQLRSGARDGGLRMVLDLAQAAQPSSFTLPPNEQYGHRLVVDLATSEQQALKPAAEPISIPDTQRDIIIAIDAGHGGDDPGAIGPNRLYEKRVVLAIAKEVKRRIDAEPGFKAQLVRTGDYYVSLRGRTAKARSVNADLFVSIHADAAQNSKAQGASVWVLSNRGASSEMGRWLAQKENAADLIGGVGSVSLEDKDEALASVLLDMSMNYARTSSVDVAELVHNKIAKFAKMHKKHIEKAAFVVLKSPDIPSILVETGFISNPSEATKLRDSKYQERMAQAISEGLLEHFWTRPPPGSLVAKLRETGQAPKGMEREYKVVAGDSLSLIAQRNGVSLGALRSANNLKSDRIRVGQVLRIPAG